jgi:ubiquinone/menaquinone biosynthesis C-methylase UbiE/uncharacterized protein YbaR (Trm112 family)
MDLAALDRLRCPTCGGELHARAFTGEQLPPERNGAAVATATRTAIRSGVLLCERCRLYYPIDSDTPVMLRFRTAFHEDFARRHDERLRELDGFRAPDGQPREGEAAIQETFTTQWDAVQEDELSFMYTRDELVELNRRVWLPWLSNLSEDERPRSVLDVGCGVGTETVALCEVTGAEEIWGADLNFALLGRRAEYRDRPGANFVVGSLFDLPFAEGAFDLVYSQGVLHHTYSTEAAFDSIARRVRPGGRLFVWVYGLEDHLAPGGASRLSKRANVAAEAVLRPLVSRSPEPVRDRLFDVLTAIWHPRMRHRERHGQTWERHNTNHSLRDWLSHRYARRHGFNEVAEWYEDRGFKVVATQSPRAYKELFGTPLWGVGMTGVKD